jgi:hypothetical protein
VNLRDYQKEAHRIATEHGFWEGPERNVGEQLALIHSEISEALEEYRSGRPLTEVTYRADNKPEGFAIELADTLIRIFDTAEKYNIDLEHCVSIKMAFNESRPHKHGKIC